MIKPPDESVLWTAEDVARYLRMSRSWVYHGAEAGLLPCVRIGGALRFEPAAIRALVTAASARGKVLPFPSR